MYSSYNNHVNLITLIDVNDTNKFVFFFKRLQFYYIKLACQLTKKTYFKRFVKKKKDCNN